jgi:SAM-dependent methyltransferase
MESDNFTGERPGWGEDFDYDEARHLAAYIHAATLAEGLHVLDAGCGEGFGTQTLTDSAREVTGVDYSAQAIEFSRKRWDRSNLSFRRVDLTDPTPFLEGLRDRIAPGGRLMLTTPNRLKTFSENPYHVREYTREELSELLGRVFSEVEIHGMHGNAKVTSFDAGREKAVNRILRLDPLGLRNLLPRAVIEAAFAKLAVLVRRQARGESGADKIVPEDFFVSADNLDEALDLVALCRP